MTHLTRTILIAACLTVLSTQIFAIANAYSRPELEKLYAEADLVAFINIVSGDTENYKGKFYKSTVLLAYKGTEVGKTLFFGSYVSHGVGGEYLAFLKKSGKTVGEISTKDKGSRTVLYDDTSEYFQGMEGGYSILPVSYECGFGKVIDPDSCDNAVGTIAVILPKKLDAFPKTISRAQLKESFVRQSAMEIFLNTLKKK